MTASFCISTVNEKDVLNVLVKLECDIMFFNQPSFFEMKESALGFCSFRNI